jgi:hypothetical protein
MSAINDEESGIFDHETEITRKVFVLQKLSASSETSHEDDIITRLDAFAKKYEQMSADMQAASKVVRNSSLYAEDLQRSAVLLQCRRKLHNIHNAMRNVDSRVLAMQHRLNNIRRALPARKHSLVESGPFQYKCVYPGGVRYRDYPSSTAKVVGEDVLVMHNQVVEIAERVFIASEQSVFLHNRGVGWLFENKKDTVCFMRVLSPQAKTVQHAS